MTTSPDSWTGGHPGLSPIIVDGVALSVVMPYQVEMVGRGLLVESTDGELIAQGPEGQAGYTLPVSRITASVTVEAQTEADWRLLSRIASGSGIHDVYLPRLVCEETGAAGADPAVWLLRRDLALPLGPLDLSPIVQVAAVDLTVITAGVPAAGEVLLPATGGRTVTFAAAPAPSAVIWYPAVLRCRVDAGEAVSGLNEVVYSLSITECLDEV